MDSTSHESSLPQLVHRIRRNSQQGIGIPGKRGLTPSDGIGSPTDHAYAPPGVLTKLDSIRKPLSHTSSVPKRMICINCNNRTNCFCKKCTSERLGLYSRKEKMFLSSEERNNLLGEISSLENHAVAIRSDYAKTEERVILLKRRIENVRMRIEMKRHECEKLDETRYIFASQFQNVFASHAKHIENNELKKRQLIERLNESEKKLAKQRFQYCLSACMLFPVREFDVNVESVTLNTNARNWAVVNERVEEGRQINIRNAYINEALRFRLASQLSQGTICVSSDLHPPLAAITNTVQLMHLLNVIFNFRPPSQISHRELCIKEKWSKEQMENDWYDICDSVVYLCSFVGMSMSNIQYKEPHLNLIQLAEYIYEFKNIHKVGSKPLTNLESVYKLIFDQRPDIRIQNEETDESWELV